MRPFVCSAIKLRFVLLCVLSMLVLTAVACGGGGPAGRNDGVVPLPSVNPGPSTSAGASPTPVPTATATASGFAEFTIPSASRSLVGLTIGPDGNAWFTEGSALKIGFVTAGGMVTEYNVASISSNPGSNVGNIAAGQGQTLWFSYTATEGPDSAAYLYQISTGGTVLNDANDTSCIGPNQCYGVNVVEPGPSGTVLAGNVLYAASAAGGLNTILQEVNAAGQLVTLDDTPSNGTPGILDDLVQSAGQVWGAWTLYSFGGPPSAPAVTAIASNGAIAAYALPGTYQPANGESPVAGQSAAEPPYATSQALTVGPDGAPWIALNGGPGSALGRVASDGSITLHAVASTNVQIAGITTGTDGALWFTEAATNKIGRMTTVGTLTEYPVPTSQAGLGRIVAGPNNTLWFTEVWANKIGRYTY